MNTRSLIEETEIQVEIQIDKFKEKFGEEPNETIVWCVFDKDSFSDEAFGNAINKCAFFIIKATECSVLPTNTNDPVAPITSVPREKVLLAI